MHPVTSTNRVRVQNDRSADYPEQGELGWSQITGLNDCYSPALCVGHSSVRSNSASPR